MKLREVYHDHILASRYFRDVAERFREKVTPEQYEYLDNNVFVIEESDSIANNYHGCGAGWVEISPSGEAVDLKYIDHDLAIVNQDEDSIVIDSLERWEDYMKYGVEEQTVLCVDFSDLRYLEPYFLENGNIRLLVNFSSWELVRF